MTNPKRPENGASGLRLLITTTSIVATLGGWALLTYNQTAASNAASPQADPLVQTLGLAPIPTLIAPPSQNTQAFASSRANQAAPSFNQPAAPRLRSAPVPLTTTRSSR